MKDQSCDVQEAISDRPCNDPAHDFIAARANIKRGCVWFTYCNTCDRLLLSNDDHYPAISDEEIKVLKMIGQLLEAAMEKLNSKET